MDIQIMLIAYQKAIDFINENNRVPNQFEFAQLVYTAAQDYFKPGD